MSIPQVQTAAVVPSPGAPIEIRKDHPVKQPDELKPGECLIKMYYSGVCHTGASVDGLVVFELELSFSSRFACQEGRLAHLRCHVRARLTVGYLCADLSPVPSSVVTKVLVRSSLLETTHRSHL